MHMHNIPDRYYLLLLFLYANWSHDLNFAFFILSESFFHVNCRWYFDCLPSDRIRSDEMIIMSNDFQFQFNNNALFRIENERKSILPRIIEKCVRPIYLLTIRQSVRQLATWFWVQTVNNNSFFWKVSNANWIVFNKLDSFPQPPGNNEF